MNNNHYYNIIIFINIYNIYQGRPKIIVFYGKVNEYCISYGNSISFEFFMGNNNKILCYWIFIGSNHKSTIYNLKISLTSNNKNLRNPRKNYDI